MMDPGQMVATVATQASFPTAINPLLLVTTVGSWPSDQAGGAGQWAEYEIYAVWRMSSNVSCNGPAGREEEKKAGRKGASPGVTGKG